MKKVPSPKASRMKTQTQTKKKSEEARVDDFLQELDLHLSSPEEKVKHAEAEEGVGDALKEKERVESPPANGASSGNGSTLSLNGENGFEDNGKDDLIVRAKTKTRQIMYRIAAGESIDQICTEMKISVKNLRLITGSPFFKSELSLLRQKLRNRLLVKEELSVQENLRTLNTTAIEALTKILMGKGGVKVPLQIQRLVAKDIIDYNLKLLETQDKGSVSETAAFITEAFERAEKRKETLKRPAHLDEEKDLPFSSRKMHQKIGEEEEVA